MDQKQDRCSHPLPADKESQEITLDSSDEQEDEKDLEFNASGKKYSVISDKKRQEFLTKVLEEKLTIKKAADECGLKLSTSKAILQTYKKEGRIGKKKKRNRLSKYKKLMEIKKIHDDEIKKDVDSENSENSDTSSRIPGPRSKRKNNEKKRKIEQVQEKHIKKAKVKGLLNVESGKRIGKATKCQPPTQSSENLENSDQENQLTEGPGLSDEKRGLNACKFAFEPDPFKMFRFSAASSELPQSQENPNFFLRANATPSNIVYLDPYSSMIVDPNYSRIERDILEKTLLTHSHPNYLPARGLVKVPANYLNEQARMVRISSEFYNPMVSNYPSDFNEYHNVIRVPKQGNYYVSEGQHGNDFPRFGVIMSQPTFPFSYPEDLKHEN